MTAISASGSLAAMIALRDRMQPQRQGAASAGSMASPDATGAVTTAVDRSARASPAPAAGDGDPLATLMNFLTELKASSAQPMYGVTGATASGARPAALVDTLA